VVLATSPEIDEAKREEAISTVAKTLLEEE
jgi:hypothetical protein